MSDTNKRETPLHIPSLEDHHCTVGLRLEKLAMVPFFRDLSEEQLRLVNKKFRANHYAQGETIYRQGETATMLRVVVAGNVKLVSNTLDGESVLLDMLKPGDFFGNPAAKSGETYRDTAQSQTGACILSISLRDFRTIMNTYAQVAVAVLDITTDRLNESRKRIRHLSTLPVRNRMAHILVTLASRFGEEDSRGLLIQLPLSRKDLADMAGTTSETASRIMSRFREDGLITSGREWVAIANKTELSRIAEE